MPKINEIWLFYLISDSYSFENMKYIKNKNNIIKYEISHEKTKFNKNKKEEFLETYIELIQDLTAFTTFYYFFQSNLIR